MMNHLNVNSGELFSAAHLNAYETRCVQSGHYTVYDLGGGERFIGRREELGCDMCHQPFDQHRAKHYFFVRGFDGRGGYTRQGWQCVPLQAHRPATPSASLLRWYEQYYTRAVAQRIREIGQDKAPAIVQSACRWIEEHLLESGESPAFAREARSIIAGRLLTHFGLLTTEPQGAFYDGLFQP